MAKITWQRVGKLSGPANLLNGRYEIVRQSNGRWLIYDRTTGKPTVDGKGWRTMKLAKEWAEASYR